MLVLIANMSFFGLFLSLFWDSLTAPGSPIQRRFLRYNRKFSGRFQLKSSDFFAAHAGMLRAFPVEKLRLIPLTVVHYKATFDQIDIFIKSIFINNIVYFQSMD